MCDSLFFCQHMIQELENAVILVHEKIILSTTSILPVLELVVRVSHHHQFYALFKVSAKVTCYCNCSHSFISLFFFLLSLLGLSISVDLCPFSFSLCFFFFFLLLFLLEVLFVLLFLFFLFCQASQHPIVKAFPLLLVTETYKYVG